MRPPWMSRSCTTSARRVYDFSTLGYIGIQCRNPANIWVRYYTNWTASTSAIDEQVILINSGYFNNMNPRVKIIRTTCGRDPTDNIIYSRHHGPARARRSLGAALGLLAALTLKTFTSEKEQSDGYHSKYHLRVRNDSVPITRLTFALQDFMWCIPPVPGAARAAAAWALLAMSTFANNTTDMTYYAQYYNNSF